MLGFDLDWRVGVVRTETGFGLELSLRRELWPGVQGVLEASAGQRFHTGTEIDRFAAEDTRVRAGLAVSMGFSGDGTMGATMEHAARIDTGSIAGRIAPQASDADLSGIPVLVDGYVVARTAKDGTFLVTGVLPGNRLVTYEEEELPLEHVARKRSFVAKVLPGATTSMTFPTEVLYGSAGRVTTGAHKGLADAAVIVVDAKGKEAGRATTNAFGYYRIDNLRPGNYEARLLKGDNTTVLASQSFHISKAFVFDIDLRAAK